MKMKLFATLAILACAASTQAADVSINDITVLTGTPTVEVPILISPDDPAETIGAMNISFSAGSAGDAIPILTNDYDGSIWDNAGSFFGSNSAVTGAPVTHNVQDAVAMLNPLQITPDGIVVTYTLDTSALPIGLYDLNPDFQIDGAGSSADTSLSFTGGTLEVQIPEPSTIALMSIFGVLGLGVAIKRRRG